LTPEEFEQYIQANVNAENELANAGVASSRHVMLKPVHQSISQEQSNHLTSAGLGSYEQSHQQSQKMSNRYISADKADSNRDEGQTIPAMEDQHLMFRQSSRRAYQHHAYELDNIGSPPMDYINRQPSNAPIADNGNFNNFTRITEGSQRGGPPMMQFLSAAGQD